MAVQTNVKTAAAFRPAEEATLPDNHAAALAYP